MPSRWKAIPFKYTVELDVARLKTLLAVAKKYAADFLQMRIYLFEVNGEEVSTTQLSVKGDAEYTQTNTQTVQKGDDASLVVRSVPDGDERLSISTGARPPVFESRFPVGHLESFVKPLQSKIVIARVKEQGHPMMLSHALCGDSDSYVRFIVAPSADGGDDEP